MAVNLYPLLYKSGIKKDGTNFEPDYCTNGQWVRFRRGRIKKIGGMKGVNLRTGPNPVRASEISLFSVPNNNDNIFVYVASTIGVSFYTITQDFNFVQTNAQIIAVNNNNNLLWQSEVVINPANNQKYIVYLGTNNATNIADNTQALFYSGPLHANALLVQNAVAVNPLANGGICYFYPYLFIYGNNGIIQYSKNNNPFDFTISADDPASGGELKIVDSPKVIYGAPTRGGSTTQALLFWTLSSVVRVTNLGGNAGPEFYTDVIAQASILSSRCVVEYDGLFFWPGVDRFFVYNGVVKEVDNLLNLDYFYDNLDINYRQKVFGLKIQKYHEIWWFYPEKGQDPNVGIFNTRAIIYNKRENSWYDVAINRDCGTASNELGIVATYGRSITVPANVNTYLWQNEIIGARGGQEQVPADPANPDVLTINTITSFVTTPTISWTSFNPMRQLTGIDRWLDMRRMEPDFVMTNDAENLQVIVNSYEYAQSVIINSVATNFTGTTEKLNLNVQGRNISFTFILTNNVSVEMGHITLLLGVGDGQ